MSKYTSIWTKAHEFFRKCDEYQHRNRFAAANALAGFAAYLEAPPECVRFGPPGSNLRLDEGFTPIGAVAAEPEGWFGGCLMLDSDTYDRPVLGYHISARYEGRAVVFRVNGLLETRISDPSPQGVEMQTFFERIINTTVEMFSNDAEDIITGKVSRPIGFLAPIKLNGDKAH